MNINTINIKIPVRRFSSVHITFLSDLHEDARSCKRSLLKTLITERKKLPNHYFFGLGDFLEYIMPDDPRYQANSTLVPERKNEIIDEMIKTQYRKYKDLKWIGILSGNHELKVAKTRFTHPVVRLCEKIQEHQKLKRDLFLGYSGRVNISFVEPRKNGSGRTVGTVRILAHHGAWCGTNDAGYGGALRWAHGYPGWDILAYGHNHQTAVRPFDVDELSARGACFDKTKYVLCCGTFLSNWHQDFVPYMHQRGYPPIHVGAPLVKITPKQDNNVEIRVTT